MTKKALTQTFLTFIKILRRRLFYILKSDNNNIKLSLLKNNCIAIIILHHYYCIKQPLYIPLSFPFHASVIEY